jgi:hypothetical protein
MNKAKAFAMIFAKCTEALQRRLQTRQDWKSTDNDPFKLLKAIEEHSIDYPENRYVMSVVFESLQHFLNLKQGPEEQLDNYFDRFKSMNYVMVSHLGSTVQMTKILSGIVEYAMAKEQIEEALGRFQDEAFITERGNDFDPQVHRREMEELQNQLIAAQETKSAIEREQWDRYVAYIYISQAYKPKYGRLLRILQQNYSRGGGGGKFPANQTDAHNMLSNHRWDEGWDKRKKDKKSPV